MRTKRSRALFVCLGIAALIIALAGAVSGAYAGPSATHELAEAAGDSAPHHAPVPRTPMVTVTYRDNNHTLKLHRGDTVALALDLEGGGFFNWREVKVDPAYLKQIASSHQGIYQAWQPGTTTITAVGDPKCYPRCLAPSVLFTLKVVIQ